MLIVQKAVLSAIDEVRRALRDGLPAEALFDPRQEEMPMGEKAIRIFSSCICLWIDENA